MNRDVVKGFTLVELLIVIAIIGILSTTAVVSLRSMKNKAKETVTRDMMEKIFKAAQVCIYQDEIITYDGINTCDGYFPVNNEWQGGESICLDMEWPIPEYYYDPHTCVYQPAGGGACRSRSSGCFYVSVDNPDTASGLFSSVVCSFNMSGVPTDGCVTNRTP